MHISILITNQPEWIFRAYMNSAYQIDFDDSNSIWENLRNHSVDL